ncbi:hypothetical protein F5050DRAFT_1770548 [Lentinula boryana]|uniref:Uncharacterized protein n=1 Tax=Lentinula boryana TaxID=40481 RepID=A0ABQ8Q8W9_9AGAR|nr:hypothetical protein F5050DRAFT_1770548 [Lentinula boryana]
MAEAYAKHTNGNAHIILIGRNATNAKAIIASFPKPTSPGAKHEFVSCDATLMTECQRTIDDLLQRLPKINYLVLSPMFVKSFHREETVEGKEPKLVLIYYARFKFMRELIPLLQTAKDAGEDAKSYIVGGPGLAKTIDYDDLGFFKKGYSFWKLRRQFPAYMDVILQVRNFSIPSEFECHERSNIQFLHLGIRCPKPFLDIHPRIPRPRTQCPR